MTQPGDRSAKAQLAYESPTAPVGRHGSLIYLRDSDGALTVTGPHSDSLARWPRLKQVLAVLLAAGVLMTMMGAALGGLTIDLTGGTLDVRGNLLARAGVHVTMAAVPAIALAYLLVRRYRDEVTIEANRDGLACRVRPVHGPGRIERWDAEQIVSVGGDIDGGIVVFLKDRRQIKLYLGRDYGESMQLADEVNRSLGRPVAAPREKDR